MNILQISTFDTKGGAAKVAFELHNSLRKHGHVTHMFVHHKQSSDPSIQTIKQTKVERILARLCATDIHVWHSDQILKTPQYKAADIVHLHNIHGNFFNINTLRKICQEKKVVWTLHDMWAITGHNVWGFDNVAALTHKPSALPIPCIEATPPLLWNNRAFLFRAKNKNYKRSAFTIVPVSRWLQGEINSSILKEKPTRVIHNGINTSVFTPTAKHTARLELSLPTDKKIILFASVGGSHNTQKGWQYTEAVIAHFANREDICFVCVGGKKPPNPLPNVHYVEYISDPRVMAEYYSAADIFLFTSVAENFPLVTLEAMACGTPVVAFDVGGTAEAVVHNTNGYIARYKDTDDLITGVENILGLPAEQIEKIAKMNTDLVRTKFDTNHMVNAYVELYNSLLHS